MLMSHWYITAQSYSLFGSSPFITDFESHIRSRSHCEHRILGTIPDLSSAPDIASKLAAGSLIAATDGSYNPHLKKAAGS